MKTVMIGYDASDQSRDALRLGAMLADAFEASLVVAVIDEALTTGGSAGRRKRAAMLQRKLDEAAELLGSRGFRGRTTWGSVPECLELIADEEDADCLVVGSTHRGEIGRVMPGSVGDRLLAGARCAVAIAPKGHADTGSSLRRIGVGIDGEEESMEAMRVADDIAGAVDGSLRLVAVAGTDVVPARMDATSPGYESALEQRLGNVLSAAAETCDPALEVAEVMIAGDPSEVLIRQTAELDLMVLGSRGYGPLRRVLLGGVASKVVRDARCPVLITPRSATSGSSRSSFVSLSSLA